MKNEELKQLICRIKSDPPLCDVELLRDISLMDWNTSPDECVELLCEILLLVNANVIVCAFCNDYEIIREYKSIFDQIGSKISKSYLTTSSKEFADYYNKFNEYMADFRTN